MLQILSLMFVLGVSTQTAQPALRVVVIEGEDAVNIIQQKTAVRPVVEVRDRNNLPVAGVLVTFSIEGGKAATFGGASTLTVATNAAGQAAVTGLTPSAAGAFHIQVSAAFQGQVATATIAQTNVMTAAQAAAASAAGGSGASGGGASSGAGGGAGGGGASSGAGGGAGGGGAGGAAGGAGGGMSATTIGIVGAAVAGGAVAATQVAGKKDDDGSANGNLFTGSISGPIVSTLVSRSSNQTCTINRAISGTAKIMLDTNTATSVAGRLEVDATDVVVSQTCGGPTGSGRFGAFTTVTGAPSSIRGNDTRADSSTGPGGETIQGTTTLFFEGALNGNVITGTIKFENKSVSSGGGGGPVDQAALGTFPVTLTKS